MKIFVFLLFTCFGSPLPIANIQQINEVSNDISDIQSKLVKAIVADQLKLINEENSSRTLLTPGLVLKTFLTVINLVEDVFYIYGGENQSALIDEYPKNILEILIGQGMNISDTNSTGTSVKKTIERLIPKKNETTTTNAKKVKKHRDKEKQTQESKESQENDDDNMVVSDDDDDDDEEDTNNNQNSNDNMDDEDEEESSEEDEGGEQPGGLLGAIISGFLGTLSKPDGSIDVEALVDLITGLSSPKDDGTYDFTGLTETVNSFFGGDGEGGGGSDIGGFLGGLVGAFVKGVANPPGAKGAGSFVANLVNAILPGLSGPPSDDDVKPELDTGGFVWSVISTLLGGSIPGFGETDKPSIIQTKFGLLKLIIGFITSFVGASKGT